MLKTVICSVFTFCLITAAFGQEKGQVKFLVDVDNGYFEIVINDTLYLKRYKDSLKPGFYRAKVWSPGYITTDVEFEIESAKTTEVEVTMAASNDFMQYEYDYKAYRHEFHKSLTLPGSLTLFTLCYSGATMLQMYKHRQLTTEHITSYQVSSDVQEIQLIKENIALSNKKFLRNRVFFYSGLVTSGILAGITAYTYNRFLKNNSEPTFNKDSPFADKFSILPNYNGLTLRLKLG